MKETCTICQASDITWRSAAGGWADVECPRCGHYQISHSAVRCLLGEDVATRRHLLSGLIRNVWDEASTRLQITSTTLASWANVLKMAPIPIPSDTDVIAKADAILRHIRRNSKFPGDIVSAQLYSVGFCRNPSEFRFCLNYLINQRVVENPTPAKGIVSWEYCITPTGWAYLSGVGAETKDQGFIAMGFRSSFADDLWRKGLDVGIRNAGYHAMRIDSKDHNNRIDDEIVAEIRRSRFVTADLTGKNAGAYFEAGFAMGLCKPVIWTCQQAEIDAGNVHFDTRQYSIVPWTENEWPDFATRLTQRIEATLGRGRYVKG